MHLSARHWLCTCWRNASSTVFLAEGRTTQLCAWLQVQVCEDADIATWMTSMTEDPSMAALLEPMVAQHSSPMPVCTCSIVLCQ